MKSELVFGAGDFVGVTGRSVVVTIAIRRLDYVVYVLPVFCHFLVGFEGLFIVGLLWGTFFPFGLQYLFLRFVICKHFNRSNHKMKLFDC